MEIAMMETLVQTGVLGAVCAFFMYKDIKKDAKIVTTLDRIATIINERLPKK